LQHFAITLQYRDDPKSSTFVAFMLPIAGVVDKPKAGTDQPGETYWDFNRLGHKHNVIAVKHSV
jgi:hypothetical protein